MSREHREKAADFALGGGLGGQAQTGQWGQYSRWKEWHGKGTVV